jgi:hypothetical protein
MKITSSAFILTGKRKSAGGQKRDVQMRSHAHNHNIWFCAACGDEKIAKQSQGDCPARSKPYAVSREIRQ